MIGDIYAFFGFLLILKRSFFIHTFDFNNRFSRMAFKCPKSNKKTFVIFIKPPGFQFVYNWFCQKGNLPVRCYSVETVWSAYYFALISIINKPNSREARFVQDLQRQFVYLTFAIVPNHGEENYFIFSYILAIKKLDAIIRFP